MRFLLSILAILTALWAPTFSIAQAPTDHSSLQVVQQYLAQFPLIRVGISMGPGSGHQSAGVTIITRLRELGFNGEIQVLYESEVKSHLGYLIPPFNPKGESEQSFPEKKLSFMVLPESSTELAKLPEVELGIMGADDHQLRSEDLRTKKLLKLQPLSWGVAPSIQQKGSSKEVLKSLKHLGFVFGLPNPENPAKFIQSEMEHTPSLASKILGLQSIVENLGRLEMTPVYGHEVAQGYQAAIFLAGILNAIQTHPEFFKGGVMVPIISNLTPAQKQHLQELIEDTNPLRKSVKIANVTDSNISSKCATLKAGEILLVHVGPISKPVFEYLYQASSLPPMVEGKNSINLAQLIGKPYLPSSLHEDFHFSAEPGIALDPTYVKARDALIKLWSKLPARPGARITDLESRAQSLGSFILESKKQRSDLNGLFSKFSLPTTSWEKDKLVQGLLIAKNWEPTQSESTEPQRPKDIYKSFLCDEALLLK